MIKIYLITNSLNEKKYVGQTTKSLEIRFKRHCWKSEHKKNMPICSAINKYGKEHFKIELIEEVETLEEANYREIYWANFYNCFSPYGYNLKAGGRKYLEMSQETKDKIGKAHKGRKASDETRKKLSNSHKGYVPTEETRKKLSERFKGKKPHENTAKGASLKNSKKYLFIDSSGRERVINNMRKFCYEHGLSPSRMCNIIKNRHHTYKGWVFVKYL